MILSTSIRIWAAAFLLTIQGMAAPASPVRTIAGAIRPAVDTTHAMETMRNVYATDRWFTFPKFEETALYLKRRLEQSGLQQIEIGGARADGKTQAGFWTMPLAWDVKQARLEMTEPEHSLLCDYQTVPSSLGMWSGSTPKEGITAEIVDIGKTPWSEVKGKLVLTSRNSAGYKYNLVKYGALGAVNGFSENPSLQDDRQWVNAWGDNGWGFTKASTPLLSFSITPRQADHIRQLIAAGQKVMVHAVADTRYYEGRYPWVTAVLPGVTLGPSAEEVLVLGHTSEQGAQDNATGVSAMVEALRTLAMLVQSGKLPRPQRTIRILLMPEVYGSLSYISSHADRMKHTVAAMTVDTPAASYDLAGTEYTLYMNPQVAMSYTDALVLRVAQACLPPARPWHMQEHTPGTDSYLGEPTIGVPDVWPYSGTGVITHHNSADKPDTVDPRSLHDLISIIATYLYFNATAGEAHVAWLAQIALDHVFDEMSAATSAGMDAELSGHRDGGSYGLARVEYFADRGKEAVLSTLRLIPEHGREKAKTSLEPALRQVQEFRDLQSERLRSIGAQPMQEKIPPEAEKIVVRRRRLGTLPLDDLPQDQWEGYPSGAWDKRVIVALYWCDGKRNLAQVIHLAEMETGRSRFDYVGYFRFLERHGYVEFAR